MTIIVIAYLESELLIEQLEGIMEYERFQVTESNKHYRVFNGCFNGSSNFFYNKLCKQLNEFSFHIEDSLFMLYPSLDQGRIPYISTLVIKRKGNKLLRFRRIGDELNKAG